MQNGKRDRQTEEAFWLRKTKTFIVLPLQDVPLSRHASVPPSCTVPAYRKLLGRVPISRNVTSDTGSALNTNPRVSRVTL